MKEEVEKCFTWLTEFVSDPAYKDELERAKQGFFKQIGEPQNGEPLLESRLASFFEWFLFTRRMDGTRFTPVQIYIEKNADKLDGLEREILEGFTKTIHSIYKVNKTGEQGALKDLFTNKNYKNVKQMPGGLSKTDIIEARLVPLSQGFLMTEAMCFHPPAAHKFLVKEIKKAKKNGDDLELLLRRFMAMSTKWERYPRMKVDQIYK